MSDFIHNKIVDTCIEIDGKRAVYYSIDKIIRRYGWVPASPKESSPIFVLTYYADDGTTEYSRTIVMNDISEHEAIVRGLDIINDVKTKVEFSMIKNPTENLVLF